MVERVSGQGRGVLRRRRVLASVPALALALTVVGVSADGPAGVAAQGTTVAPIAVAGQLADETVAGRSSFSPGPESGSTDPLQVTAVSAMAAGAAGPRRAAIRGDRYLTARVNIRTAPSLSARVVTVLPRGSKVRATKARRGQFTQIVFRDQTRYAATRYLSSSKPKSAKARTNRPAPGKAAPVSRAKCRSGSSVESRLTRDAVLVHRTLCARFPQISAFGGYRAGGGSYHGSGRAVDAMISNRSTGWKIANYVRKNRKALGVSEVIYAKKIWTVQRNSEGWRSMSDRGSVSANHLDHVHVSVYGNAAQ